MIWCALLRNCSKLTISNSIIYQKGKETKRSFLGTQSYVNMRTVFSLYITNWRHECNEISLSSSQCKVFLYHAFLKVPIKNSFQGYDWSHIRGKPVWFLKTKHNLPLASSLTKGDQLSQIWLSCGDEII